MSESSVHPTILTYIQARFAEGMRYGMPAFPINNAMAVHVEIMAWAGERGLDVPTVPGQSACDRVTYLVEHLPRVLTHEEIDFHVEWHGNAYELGGRLFIRVLNVIPTAEPTLH